MKQLQIRLLNGEVYDKVDEPKMHVISHKGWFALSDCPKDSVLGIYEFETESEADKARLDWLEGSS